MCMCVRVERLIIDHLTNQPLPGLKGDLKSLPPPIMKPFTLPARPPLGNAEQNSALRLRGK